MKRKFSATIRIRPAASATPTIRSTSARLGAIGFSTRTCRPASSAVSASRRCRSCGVHTIAPAARGSRTASSYAPKASAAPNSRANARAPARAGPPADAVLDAELPASAVQGHYYANVVGSDTEHQLHTGPQARSILGIPTIPTTRFEAACASSHAAFRHAVMEIAAGVSDVVLVGGAERVLNVPTPESTEYFAYASDASWDQTLGLTFPGVSALIACAHMQRYR